MPTTAKNHFDNDIQRAWGIYTNAQSVLAAGNQALADDLMLSAVAMSVGAMDAYLCDAFVDCLSKALRAYYQKTWPGTFPATYKKQMLPAGEVLNSTRVNRPLWSIRMAARKIMERENILAISKVDDLFNPILPAGKKLWEDFMQILMAHNRKRFTKYTSKTWPSVSAAQRPKEIKKVISTFKGRISYIVQIRHDWIHNCGRPKSSVNTLTKLQALSAIRDVQTFVDELDNHINTHRVV